MGRLSGYLGAGRSLATGALVGALSHGRLEPLDLWGVPDVEDRHPSRVAELDSLVDAGGIARVQEHLADGRVTSEEITAHLLGRVRVRESGLNSLIALAPDALEQARWSDARRVAGQGRGPLEGIPITVKDTIETAGPVPTTGGAEILAGHVAGQDAAVVSALRAAGAVILAKANLSELAGAVVRSPGFSAVGGQGVNPYGAAFTPGGSSSGSAGSVAGGLALASVGTETSGSLVAPSAFHGLVGMKPTHGLVEGTGAIPLVRHQDDVGPIGPTVADVAVLLQVMTSAPLEVDLTGQALDRVRVAVLAEDIRAQKSPHEATADNLAMLARIHAGLRAAGAEPVEAAVVATTPRDEFERGFLTVVLGGVSHDTVGYLAAAGAPVTNLAELHAYNLRKPRRRMPAGQFFLDLALAQAITRDAYEDAALAHRGLAQQMLDATFDAAGSDVLVSLSTVHSSLYATAGYPAVTVPLGLRANGMPTGATLIGRAGGDGQLLGIAHAFEQATQLRVPPATV